MKEKNFRLKYGFLLIVITLVGLAAGVFLNVFFYRNTVPPAVYGDVNQDYIVDVKDGDLLYRCLTEQEADVQIQQYDFNQDAVVNYVDVLYYYAYCNSDAFHQLSFQEFVEKINRKELSFDEDS